MRRGLGAKPSFTFDYRKVGFGQKRLSGRIGFDNCIEMWTARYKSGGIALQVRQLLTARERHSRRTCVMRTYDSQFGFMPYNPPKVRRHPAASGCLIRICWTAILSSPCDR